MRRTSACHDVGTRTLVFVSGQARIESAGFHSTSAIGVAGSLAGGAGAGWLGATGGASAQPTNAGRTR